VKEKHMLDYLNLHLTRIESILSSDLMYLLEKNKENEDRNFELLDGECYIFCLSLLVIKIKHTKSFNYDEVRLDKLDMFDLEKYNLFEEHAVIKPNERIGEYIMLGFRLKSGIDKNRFTQLFNKDFDDMYYNKILPFIKSGHIVDTGAGYAFSREGMFVSNYILSRIIDFE